MSAQSSTVTTANEKGRPFLTAQWKDLAMLNFEVDPSLLRRYVPRHTELDTFQGRSMISMVGFLFRDTRVLGIAVPFHRDFEEINLRFYVRAKGSEGWRRGVVFIKEVVPRRAIALVANVLYGEPYQALPTRHASTVDPASGARKICYEWVFRGACCALRIETASPPQVPSAGSEQEFIAEHYWGYTDRGGRGTSEYRVEHPSWRVSTAIKSELSGDMKGLYGDHFGQFLALPPRSAFLAEGSAVTVYKGGRLRSL